MALGELYGSLADSQLVKPRQVYGILLNFLYFYHLRVIKISYQYGMHEELGSTASQLLPSH